MVEILVMSTLVNLYSFSTGMRMVSSRINGFGKYKINKVLFICCLTIMMDAVAAWVEGGVLLSYRG